MLKLPHSVSLYSPFNIFQTYIFETWNRIPQLQFQMFKSPEVQQLFNSDKNEKDKLITEHVGSTTTDFSFSEDNNVNQQLKSIEVEPRRSFHFTVLKFWTESKTRYSFWIEATPSNQVSVERAFSALELVLTNIRSTLGEDTRSNNLMIKLNKPLSDKIASMLCSTKSEQWFCFMFIKIGLNPAFDIRCSLLLCLCHLVYRLWCLC